MMSSKHIVKAESFISSGNDDDLVHAVLELRLAIEEHVYRKLQYFAGRHGEKLLFEKWQPNRAIKILCQLEPNADRSYSLSYAETGENGNRIGPYKELGKHESLSSKWISTHYHKLGSHLHLDQRSAMVPKADREYLDDIASELRRVSTSSLITSIASTVSFSCKLCGAKITCCTESLPNLQEIVCPGTNCSATYESTQSDDGWKFKVNGSDFTCEQCNHVSFVLPADLHIGARLTCSQCSNRYIITEQNWGMRRDDS